MELDLDPLPTARALARVPSGAPQTIRIAISSYGGGTTTSAVPMYEERDHRIAKAAAETKCDWP